MRVDIAMGPVLCSDDGMNCLIIGEDAVEQIKQHALKFHPLETGGILLGGFDLNLRNATVLYASAPPSDSHHARYSFYRGTNGLKQLLAWGRKQKPKMYYLGEWHTHPGGNSNPSKIDITQLKSFAKNRVFGAVTPLLLVVGGNPTKSMKFKVAFCGLNLNIKLLSPINL